MEAALESYRTSELSLPELVKATGKLLAQIDLKSNDERVRAVPDVRTLRYYQTLGLLQKPIRYKGRTALYGFEHLLQVVAIKLLQAREQSLAQVQRSLQAATTGQLESAVREALGAGPPPAVAPQRPLLSVLVRPGVIVTIDPAEVPDPEAVLQRIIVSLSDTPGGSS